MNTWFADKDIEVVEIEGKWYALNGWNGEDYTECWETEQPTYGTSCEVLSEEHVVIRPILKPYPDDEEQFYVSRYELL